jgi:glycosyltransferase involved in cell wall biosynthesis
MRRILSEFAETWFQIPDRRMHWFLPAFWMGLKLVKQCDVIYSTSGPFTDHLVAWALHKFTGKPWVADFRDPWTQYVGYNQSSKLRAWIDTRFERLFLKAANLVVVTCSATAKGFQSLYPFLPEDKFVEVTNGFDAQDFEFSPPPIFEQFTIAYTGRFGIIKNASESFFRALRELCDEVPSLVNDLRIVFAGTFGEQHYDLLRRLELESVVKPLGYVSHKESIELLLRSHVLLLTLSDEPGVALTYPGKLFEYLAAEKTILALVPGGATADLIRKLEAGVIVPPTDIGAIKAAIFDLYEQYKQGRSLERRCDTLQDFERKVLTERLAHQFNALM